jgi:hypothetical protein
MCQPCAAFRKCGLFKLAGARRPHRALPLRPLRPETPVLEPIHGKIRPRPASALINQYKPAA